MSDADTGASAKLKTPRYLLFTGIYWLFVPTVLTTIGLIHDHPDGATAVENLHMPEMRPIYLSVIALAAVLYPALLFWWKKSNSPAARAQTGRIEDPGRPPFILATFLFWWMSRMVLVLPNGRYPITWVPVVCAFAAMIWWLQRRYDDLMYRGRTPTKVIVGYYVIATLFYIVVALQLLITISLIVGPCAGPGMPHLACMAGSGIGGQLGVLIVPVGYLVLLWILVRAWNPFERPAIEQGQT